MEATNKLDSFLLVMKYVDFKLCTCSITTGSCNHWVTGRRENIRPTIWRKSSKNQIPCPQLDSLDDLLLWALRMKLKSLGIFL